MLRIEMELENFNFEDSYISTFQNIFRARARFKISSFSIHGQYTYTVCFSHIKYMRTPTSFTWSILLSY